MKTEEILKTGSVEVHAKVGGIRQLHVLKVTYEKTVWGMVPYLVSKHKLPTAELLRLAEELGLPIKCHGVTAFPKGKAAQDFARKDGDDKKAAAAKDDPKPEKKMRKKVLSHDAITKGGEEGEEPAEEGTEEAGTATEGDPEPAEETTTAEEDEAAEAAPAEPKGESAPAVLISPPSEPQVIEIEGASHPDSKKEAQEQKEEAPKEKKRTFSDELLSEGILR